MRFLQYVLLLIGLVFLCMSNSYAFDKEGVHPAINDKSADESCLDDVLKENGLPNGIKEKMIAVNGKEKTVVEWLKQGGTEEDKPVSRTLNHFHDPPRNGLRQNYGAGWEPLLPFGPKTWRITMPSGAMFGNILGRSLPIVFVFG